jgi:hypothetical protein
VTVTMPPSGCGNDSPEKDRITQATTALSGRSLPALPTLLTAPSRSMMKRTDTRPWRFGLFRSPFS